MDQIQVHNRIQQLLENSPKDIDIAEVLSLISLNEDAKRFFFAQADGRWLNWLWENGLLNAVKERSDSTTKYSYRTPELGYLVRMVSSEPRAVADVMLSVDIAKENFNPEVLDQFLRIASDLPSDQLARIVPKILKEKWVELMSDFRDWGFEYEKMFKTLSEANDYEHLLLLAEAVLSVKDRKTFLKGSKGYFKDNPFYFTDLSYSKVFPALAQVSSKYQENALQVVCNTLSRIVQLADKSGKEGYFEYKDLFYLYSTDIFTLSLQEETNNSDRENVKSLVATIKKLVSELFKNKCDDSVYVKRVFNNYIASLPSASSTWRLSLYVLTLCPKIFTDELKLHFSRLFDSIESGHGYYEVEGGTEYHKTLKQCFGALDAEYRHNYITNVLKYFGTERTDKKEEAMYKHTGWEIFSSIHASLSDQEKRLCKEIFGKECDENYKPEPLLGEARGGVVVPRGMITQQEFGRLEIQEIIRRLKDEWKPENLKEENTFNDFLTPKNAEGIGSQLRKDMPERLQIYVDNSKLFFDREKLHEHYTESFYRGLQEAIRADREKAKQINWNALIEALLVIVASGLETKFPPIKHDRGTFNGWLANWEGVHNAIADILKDLLSGEPDGEAVLDFAFFRNDLLTILEYLLQNSDPEPKDEEIETAVSKTRLPGEQEEYLVSDPFSIAINSVRGRSFESLTLFLYQDGKNYSKTERIKIADDVKAVYEGALKKENTRALMFMYGHYLPSFYFRDRDWILGLLSLIFPNHKRHLYIAAWEGYLSNNLYEEIFFESEFQKLYDRGLTLTNHEDTGRRFFKELDEGLAVHLALAFMVYHERFGFEDSLFKEFWKNNEERQIKFISFIGRMFVSGDNQKVNELLEKDDDVKHRLMEFWDWVLGSKVDKKLFEAFSYWMNCKKAIFDPSWLAERIKQTLEKTGGTLAWEYGLDTSIVKLAESAPKQTLQIIQLYLLQGGVRNKQIRMPFLRDDEWFEAIKMLYNGPETRDVTYKLINDLIAEGGSMFWRLKEIVD
jgi:hypothetical protein